MGAAGLRKLAKRQEDAAAQARSIGANYMASRHEAVARRLREDAARAKPS